MLCIIYIYICVCIYATDIIYICPCLRVCASENTHTHNTDLISAYSYSENKIIIQNNPSIIHALSYAVLST